MVVRWSYDSYRFVRVSALSVTDVEDVLYLLLRLLHSLTLNKLFVEQKFLTVTYNRKTYVAYEMDRMPPVYNATRLYASTTKCLPDKNGLVKYGDITPLPGIMPPDDQIFSACCLMTYKLNT